jgi:hypothetical protein
MPNRTLVAVFGCLTLTIGPAASAPAPGDGQTGAGETPTSTAAWTLPRTPDGQPDLQGVWLSNSATPLQRPRQFEGRARLTDEEVADLQRGFDRLFFGGLDSDFAVGDGVIQAVLENPARYTNPNSTHDSGDMARLVFDNRTSLVTDPPDGRVPPLTPQAQRRRNAGDRRPVAGPEDLSNPLRCVSWGVPRLGGRYGAGDLGYYRIVQSPGYVAIFLETGHETRLVPLDGRPHLSPAIRQLSGDSRGRWDGDTLVVETTNFSPDSDFRGAAENLQVVERFTREGPDLMRYEMTMIDSTMWTRPWTAVMPLRRVDDTLYEFACHEGNHELMSGMLRAAQAEAAGGR